MSVAGKAEAGAQANELRVPHAENHLAALNRRRARHHGIRAHPREPLVDQVRVGLAATQIGWTTCPGVAIRGLDEHRIDRRKPRISVRRRLEEWSVEECRGPLIAELFETYRVTLATHSAVTGKPGREGRRLLARRKGVEFLDHWRINVILYMTSGRQCLPSRPCGG